MHEFISVEDARRRILERIEPLGSERVFLTQARGRVLAEPLASPDNSPRFAHASRDGFALRFQDLQGPDTRLELVGQSAAGAPSQRDVGPAQAVRITTGAPLPPGADTVVMQEYCRVDAASNTLAFEQADAIKPGQWVRQIGQDMAAGEIILEAGMRLGPADIGLLAGLGRAMVTVSRRPRVAIVSTGDELVDPGTSPGPAQIVNSNAYLLGALVEAFGGIAHILPIAPDDADAIRQTFAAAIAGADLVLSSGGVSVGAFDHTREVLDALTGGMDFWKIRIKPGKPLAFGVAERGAHPTPLVGLPGNPNACFVCFHQFVRPALERLGGQQSALALDPAARRPTVLARLAAPVQTTARRRVYLGGSLQEAGPDAADPRPIFHPAANQESGNLRLFSQVTAFGIVDEGVADLQAGDAIQVERI